MRGSDAQHRGRSLLTRRPREYFHLDPVLTPPHVRSGGGSMLSRAPNCDVVSFVNCAVVSSSWGSTPHGVRSITRHRGRARPLMVARMRDGGPYERGERGASHGTNDAHREQRRAGELLDRDLHQLVQRDERAAERQSASSRGQRRAAADSGGQPRVAAGQPWTATDRGGRRRTAAEDSGGATAVAATLIGWRWR